MTRRFELCLSMTQVSTRLLKFTSLDPTTLDTPSNPLGGFWPPGTDPPGGGFAVALSDLGKLPLDGLGGKQAAILAKCDEENPVQELLRAPQNEPGVNVRIQPAQSGERAPPREGILRIKLDREIAADFLGLLNERIEMGWTVERDHSARVEQEDEFAELSVVARQRLGVKTLEGLLIGPLVIEAGLADV